MKRAGKWTLFSIGLPILGWLLFLGAATWKLASVKSALRESGIATTVADYRSRRPPLGPGGAGHIREALKGVQGAIPGLANSNAWRFRLTEKPEVYGPLEAGLLRQASTAWSPTIVELRRARGTPVAAVESPDPGPRNERGAIGIQQYKWLMEALTVQSLLEAREGNPDAALAAVADWRCLESYFRGLADYVGPIYSTFCLESILFLAGHAVRQGTEPRIVEGWLAALPGEAEILESCEDLYRFEIAMVSDLVDQHPEKIRLAAEQLNRPSSRVPAWLALPWIKWDLARCLENRARAVDSARMSIDLGVPVQEGLEKELHEGSTWARPVQGVIPARSPRWGNETNLLARWVAVRAGLELELHRAKTGAYPGELAGDSAVKGVTRTYVPGVSVKAQVEGGPAFTWKLRNP